MRVGALNSLVDDREVDTSRADSRFAPGQWETALLFNDASHWLGASLKSALLLNFCVCDGVLFPEMMSEHKNESRTLNVYEINLLDQ